YSGTVYDTITNTMGCDSLMVFNLTIKASTSETRTVDACFTYTQPETGNVYSTSGTYTDVVTNAAGCNHTITTVLTINTANAGTLSVSGITLTCSAVGVTYKWVDCDNDYSYILGATSQSYTPIRNGNYACWVTTPEGCTDTTGMCMSINSVSLEEFEITESDINIYPNPATDFVTVDILSQNIEEDVTIKMFDAIGKLVYSQEVSSTNNKVTFDVSQFENGVYTVTVSNEFFLTTKKVVVSK
ncbi:MAG: T9SS type A sorting domain-containing protein, partial [Flavobacteriales bacterium]